jgi:hypothetical protein
MKTNYRKELSLLLWALFISIFGMGQVQSDSLVNSHKNSFNYTTPNTLATHPLEIFQSRYQSNFQLQAAQKPSFSINISSGNVWLPYVKGYIPLDEKDIAYMKELPWHYRNGALPLDAPFETISLEVDGTIRMYQFEFSIPFRRKHEVRVNTRLFSMDAGRVPYSLISSDQFLEWFHSNIAGGEDPFARRVYGFNRTRFAYTDIHGNSLHVPFNKLLFSGIDLSYYYYPTSKWMTQRNISVNAGAHLGLNLNIVNPSIDIGLSATVNRTFWEKNNRHFQLGINTVVIRRNIVEHHSAMQLSDRKYAIRSEILFAYHKRLRNGNTLTFGTTYALRNAISNPEIGEYIIMAGEGFSTHWNYAVSHLYRPMQNNSAYVAYSFGAYTFWSCMKEDFHVDNAPDSQMVVGIKVEF